MEDKTFERFPDIAKCPLCGTSEDKECCLIPIDGTDDNGICEAQPVHIECIKQLHKFRYNKNVGVIYRTC